MKTVTEFFLHLYCCSKSPCWKHAGSTTFVIKSPSHFSISSGHLGIFAGFPILQMFSSWKWTGCVQTTTKRHSCVIRLVLIFDFDNRTQICDLSNGRDHLDVPGQNEKGWTFENGKKYVETYLPLLTVWVCFCTGRVVTCKLQFCLPGRK